MLCRYSLETGIRTMEVLALVLALQIMPLRTATTSTVTAVINTPTASMHLPHRPWHKLSPLQQCQVHVAWKVLPGRQPQQATHTPARQPSSSKRTYTASKNNRRVLSLHHPLSSSSSNSKSRGSLVHMLDQLLLHIGNNSNNQLQDHWDLATSH